MANFKTGVSLNSKNEYNRYFGNFRGVDFSSDHTLVNENRLAYLVNMYRDYNSGQGQTIETIPGFRVRNRFCTDLGPAADKSIYGIHYFKCKETVNGIASQVIKVLVHCGECLFLWNDFAVQTGTSYTESQRLKYASNTAVVMNKRKSVSFIFNNKLYILDGKNYLVFDGTNIAAVEDTAYIPTLYIHNVVDGNTEENVTEYEQRNMLQDKYILTYVADGTTSEFPVETAENGSWVSMMVYVKVDGTEYTAPDADVNTQGDGTDNITTNNRYVNPESNEGFSIDTYVYDINTANQKTVYKIVFDTAPVLGTRIDVCLSKEAIYYKYSGDKYQSVGESLSSGSLTGVSTKSMIKGCTIAAVFDGRVFLSGNPDFPNYIFYSQRNSTGYNDPSYFGVLNYQQDGMGITPITGMIPVSDTLAVLKGDTQQDGAIYFHKGADTGDNIITRIYPSVSGLNGIGCVNGFACVNFLDDPVFISQNGVEAIGQLSVRLERAVEHRSSLIDAKLLNCDLKNASVCEWNGYLCVLTDKGRMFLADSRQKFTHSTGVYQYEWFYVESLAHYSGQYNACIYAKDYPTWLEDIDVTVDSETIPLEIASQCRDANNLSETVDMRGKVANEANNEGIYSDTLTFNEGLADEYQKTFYYKAVAEEIDGNDVIKAYLCEQMPHSIGGMPQYAVCLANIENILFFGTSDGTICCFNTDKREENGSIPAKWYTFDNRIIYSACATLMDNCQIPHLTKSTIKRSTVIKTRAFAKSTVKIKVRTNKKANIQVARISSSSFSFSDFDFSDFNFMFFSDSGIYSVKEKEKQWMEKQYYIYSDEYCRPFSLIYVAYRYVVAGRFKQR